MEYFYEFVLTYRGEKKRADAGKLAEWIFNDFGFPQHSSEYHEVSDYLEWNSPFPEALRVFDDLWTEYIIRISE